MKRNAVGVLLALCVYISHAQAGSVISPLPVRNLDAPMMRFFDPTPDSALRALHADWSFELNQHYATVNVFDRTLSPQVLVDMELYVVDPVMRYAVTSDLDITVRSPLLLPSSGLFDAAIQRFHGWFSMPNGGRELRPNDVYAYRVQHDRGAGWRSKSRWELGNVELSSRYRLLGDDRRALAALAAVKLPTASQARGWGSGAADLALGVVASTLQNGVFAHLEGWLIQPLARDVPGIRYHSYWRGSLTTGYQLSDQLSVMFQAQGGSSPYEGTVAMLDHPPFLISVGLRGGGTSDWGWNVSVVENISQKTTQDISITVGLNWQMH